MIALTPNDTFGGLTNAKALLDVPAGLDVLAILPFGYPARPSAAARSSASRYAKSRISSATAGRSSEGSAGYAPPVTTSVWPLTKSLSGLQKR